MRTTWTTASDADVAPVNNPKAVCAGELKGVGVLGISLVLGIFALEV